MLKLYVIIPDITSGNIFNKVLNQQGITTISQYHQISPRVINNRITTSNNVTRDLNRIFRTFTDQTQSVVIACNTLQLWLDKIAPQFRQHVKIYTTFEACQWKFQNQVNKPLWLGTTPLVEVTRDFPTLLSLNLPDTQNQVQEIIWRLKMYYGDDISTAFPSVKADQKKSPQAQWKIILSLKQQILSTLRTHGVKQVISGCTELPLIFNQQEDDINFIDPAEVLAEYIKSESVAIVFAGGTISSQIDRHGTHHGGKKFNLVENLIKLKPGVIKNINLTKAKIAYQGLSEDMTRQNQYAILTQVRHLIKNGVSRIVITHGTDAMEQTGRYLAKNLISDLKNSRTSVIMTGSNKDSTHPQTDAWDNLSLAIHSPDQVLQNEVYLAFNQKIVLARNARKIFLPPDLMYYLDENSREYHESLKLFDQQSQAQKQALSAYYAVLPTKAATTYFVNQIRPSHTRFLTKINNRPNIKAVVFVLYHSGTASSIDPRSSVAALVKQLIKRGITCFGATENGEPTDLNAYTSSVKLRQAGMIPLYDLIYPVAKHKINLIFAKNPNLSQDLLVKEVLTPRAGELNLKN